MLSQVKTLAWPVSVNVSRKGGDGRCWRVAGKSSLKPSHPRVSAKYEVEVIKNNHSNNIG